MYNSENILTGLIIWLLASGGVWFVYRSFNLPTVGLPFVYLFALTLNHMLGAAVHALPWYSYRDPLITGLGFQLTVYALLAFCAGVLSVALAGKMLFRKAMPQPEPMEMSPRLPLFYTVSGLLAYFVLTPLIGAVPTVAALVSTSYLLFVIGISLGCWLAWRKGARGSFALWLLSALLLPLFTVVFQGFLGYGIMYLAMVLLFVVAFIKLNWRLLPIMLLVAYFGLSVYVNYMRDRNEIRAVVWGGEAVTTRVEEVYATTNVSEWFDPYNQQHLQAVDGRLNQNVLVGVAAFNLQNGYVSYAQGETIWQALIAPIPRLFWPEKPVFGGSGDLVSTYTGIEFAKGTSVGIGQVMEFYINFGTPGIVSGFLLIGIVLALLDRAASRYLAAGNWRRFTLCYLPALGLLQVGGSLVEVTGTVAAGFVLALIVGALFQALLPTKPTIPTPAAVPRVEQLPIRTGNTL